MTETFESTDRQAGSFGSGQVQPVAAELHEDCGFGGSCVRLREGILEGGGAEPDPEFEIRTFNSLLGVKHEILFAGTVT
jgi:hypothetical protein